MCTRFWNYEQIIGLRKILHKEDSLSKYRGFGHCVEDVAKINQRVVGGENGIDQNYLPKSLVSATKLNMDRMAISDGICLQHLISTYSNDPSARAHCKDVSNLEWRVG